MVTGTETGTAGGGEATAEARARALASTVRMRILRICLHEAHSNREISQVLGINPGTALHHVRTLVDTGLLRAEEPRRGARGSREVPYRATGLSWSTLVPGISATLIDTFLEETRGLPADEIDVSRLGLKLDAAGRRELMDRLHELLVEFKNRPPDAAGEAISVMVAVHPDRQAG